MKYQKGQKVLYIGLDRRKYNATILERKVDYPKGFIDTPFTKGNFDYLIEIVRDNKIENTFALESDLI